MSNLVLLGVAVFDNVAYVGAGAPDVVRQVCQRLPHGSRATLLAVDGSTTGSALGSGDFLAAPAGSAGEALLGLAEIGEHPCVCSG